jgi:hypothetical protein
MVVMPVYSGMRIVFTKLLSQNRHAESNENAYDGPSIFSVLLGDPYGGGFSVGRNAMSCRGLERHESRFAEFDGIAVKRSATAIGGSGTAGKTHLDKPSRILAWRTR